MRIVVTACFMATLLAASLDGYSAVEDLKLPGRANVESFARDPLHPERVIAVDLGEYGSRPVLLRSMDAGRTWNLIPVPQGYGDTCPNCGGPFAKVFSSTDAAGEVFMAARSPILPVCSPLFPTFTVLRSRDFGATWTDLRLESLCPGGITNFFLDAVNPDTYYVSSGVGDRALRSDNAGGSWRRIAPQDFVSTGFLTQAPWGQHTLFLNSLRSLDGGSTWQPLLLPQGFWGIPHWLDPFNSFVFFGGVGGLVVSDNDGASFAPIPCCVIDGVSKTARVSQLWFLSDNLTLARLEDLPGSRLARSDGSLAEWAPFEIDASSVSPSPSPEIPHLVAGNQAIYCLNPEGTQLSDCGVGLRSVPVAAISVMGAQGTKVIAQLNGIGIRFSQDNGENWIAAESGLDMDTRALRFSLDAVNHDLVYLTSTTGAYRAIDPSNGWLKLNVPITSISSVMSHPSMSGLVLASGSGGLNTYARSVNYGDSWEAIPLSGAVINGIVTITGASPHTLLYGERLFRASLSGELPSVLNEIDLTALAADPLDSLHLIGGDATVVQSFDGGLTWSEIDCCGASSTENRITEVFFDPNSPTTVYILRRGVGIYVSTDSGGMWTEISTPGAPYSLHLIAYSEENTAAYSVVSAGQEEGNLRRYRVPSMTLGVSSLIRSYYQSVLGREPDHVGQAFWEGQAMDLYRRQADIGEVFYAMAMAFFISPEYASRQTADSQFLSDLYRTFFLRDADASGLSFWMGELGGGKPREAVMNDFLFSPEFASFMDATFGLVVKSRAEVSMVLDFYRGLLSRLPDHDGLSYWTGRFRAAQCAGEGAVYAEADAISKAFIFSPEYSARARSGAQQVSDLYNAFLKRGGDLAGVRYWIDQIQSGRRTLETTRQDFISSPEFRGRVQAVIQAGCVQ